MQVSSYDFRQRLSQILHQVKAGEMVEIVVRGAVRATLEPFYPNSTDEAWPQITSSELGTTFRALEHPRVILYYSEPVAVYTPLQPFGAIVKRPLIPLDDTGRDEDPYSWAVMAIRAVLEEAYIKGGKMSEGELGTLAAIARVVAEEDPYWLTVAMEELIKEEHRSFARFHASIR